MLDSLTAFFRGTAATTVPTSEDFLTYADEVTGIQHVNYDANKPVYGWLQKVGNAIFGPDDVNAGKTADATLTGQKSKWDTYVPVVLLVSALILLFWEE